MKTYHASIRKGLAGGAALVLLHLIVTIIFLQSPKFGNGKFSLFVNLGEVLMMVVSILFYIGFARSAAQAQCRYQVDNGEESLAGVQSEGTGAAFFICVFDWVFIIIRALILNESRQIIIITEPLSLACNMALSGILAMAIGGWSARQIVKKYQKIQID